MVLSHQSGLRFAVAVSGTALTTEHLSLLGRLSKRLVLALDNDEAGIRAGLKSAAMALASGFDVKIPHIEGGKDPADLAAKDPELLKAAVRSSIPAVEFFLTALRSGAKDERAYKKTVEVQILPLIAAILSKIDQAHFIHIVAERLRVPEDAVRTEVAKRPQVPVESSAEEGSSQGSGLQPDVLSPFESAVGMILFHFADGTDARKKLVELLPQKRIEELQEKLAPEAERLQFEFDGRGEDEAVICAALLEVIGRGVLDEEIAIARDGLRLAEQSRNAEEAQKFTQKLSELNRRRHGLHK